MEAGRALGASLEIIKALYETAETYRRLEKINGNILNEMALLLSIKDQILQCRRIENNQIVDNYLIDIFNKLNKFKNIVENIGKQNFFRKIIYTKKVNKISSEISKSMKKLKFLIDIKRDLQQSSKLDVANIITDIKGREFWENNFGSENTYIQSNLFFSAIRMNTSLLSNEIDFLKKIINDDNDKYISAFEFQEWLDFFGDFSVAMKRTIESLFYANTYDVYDWYYKIISKKIVKSLLFEHPFIIRKHSNQKGIFIVNFKFGEEICELFIRNHQNEFFIEQVPNMKPFEIHIYERIDRKKSQNLRDFAISLEYIINPPKKIVEQKDWEEQRNEHIDKPIPPEKSPLDNILELPGISHLKNGLELVVDTGIGTVKGIVNTSADIFHYLTPR